MSGKQTGNADAVLSALVRMIAPQVITPVEEKDS